MITDNKLHGIRPTLPEGRQLCQRMTVARFDPACIMRFSGQSAQWSEVKKKQKGGPVGR